MVKYIILIISFSFLTVNSSLKANDKQDDTTVVQVKNLDKGFSNENVANNEQLKDTLIVSVSELTQGKYNRRDNFKYIFPIITLILGFLLNRGYEYVLDRVKVKKEGERWIAELRCLEKPLQNQKLSINKFLEAQKVDKFQKTDFGIHNILNCEIFKSLDKSYLLKYLKSKKKDFSHAVNLSNEIHGYISSLTYNFNNLTEKFNEYIKATTGHFDKFNYSLQELSRHIAEYGVKVEKRISKDPIEDDAYRKLIDLYSKHILPHLKDGKVEIFSLQDNFLFPIVKILAQYRLNDELNDIRLSTANCNNEIKAIRMEKGYLQENLTNSRASFDKSKEKLIKLIDKIK